MASRSDSVPLELGYEVAHDLAPVGLRDEDAERKGDRDYADEGRDRRLQPSKPVSLEAEDGEGSSADEERGGKKRHARQQMKAESGADDLRDVRRHRHELGLDPEAVPGSGHRLAAGLGEVQAAGDAELRRERLDEHRHQVGADDDPDEQVAELRARGAARGEVARIDVGDGRDERRPEERPERPQAGTFARERRLRGPKCRSLAGQDIFWGRLELARPGQIDGKDATGQSVPLGSRRPCSTT